MHADQLLCDALDQRWKDYMGELGRCQTEFSNEAVYDLRVATGRVITVFQLVNTISPRPRLQKIIRTFEDQLKELDDLRDTQVILAEISETIQELPELQGFQKNQQVMEERILRSLRKKMRRFHPVELAKRVRKTRHFIETAMDENLEGQLLEAVDKAFSITRRRFNWVDLGRPVTIQRVGSAFKVFRYRVEMIYPVFDRFPTKNLEEMYRYQSLMGDIQDVDIFMQTLAEFFEQTSDSDIETIRSYYGRRHGEAVAGYAREMDQLHAFWRPAPSQQFPWKRTE
jgi:CHAD domain-containing protein